MSQKVLENYRDAIEHTETNIAHMVSFGTRLMNLVNEFRTVMADVYPCLPQELRERMTKIETRFFNMACELSEVMEEIAMGRAGLLGAISGIIGYVHQNFVPMSK